GGVRKVDRQGVAGWAEVDKPGPVDVVVGPQAHRAYLKTRLTRSVPKPIRITAPPMKARPTIAIAELVRTRDTSPLLARPMKMMPSTASRMGAILLAKKARMPVVSISLAGAARWSCVHATWSTVSASSCKIILFRPPRYGGPAKPRRGYSLS